MKMKIAIDVDEVVFEFFEKYLEFIESMGMRRVSYEDIYCYRIWDVLGISKELAFELYDKYGSSSYFDEAVFIDGAKDGVCFLRDNFDIYFITARSKTVSKKTRASIFEEFGVLGNKVIFSGSDNVEGLSKCEICRDLEIGLIIEDSGQDSLKYAENGLRVLLLDKPWNQGVEHERIFRCKDWGDVLIKVEEMKDYE